MRALGLFLVGFLSMVISTGGCSLRTGLEIPPLVDPIQTEQPSRKPLRPERAEIIGADEFASGYLVEVTVSVEGRVVTFSGVIRSDATGSFTSPELPGVNLNVTTAGDFLETLAVSLCSVCDGTGKVNSWVFKRMDLNDHLDLQWSAIGIDSEFAIRAASYLKSRGGSVGDAIAAIKAEIEVEAQRDIVSADPVMEPAVAETSPKSKTSVSLARRSPSNQ